MEMQAVSGLLPDAVYDKIRRIRHRVDQLMYFQIFSLLHRCAIRALVGAERLYTVGSSMLDVENAKL